MKIIEFIKELFKKNGRNLLEDGKSPEILDRNEAIKKYGFKSYLNHIIYDFASANIDNKKINITDNELKQDILLYFYYVISTMTNQDYVANINTIQEFQQIEFLQNDNNYQYGIHNKKILMNIRNALAHKSGDIQIDENGNVIISNSSKYGQVVNNFSIKVKENTLIEILKKSTLNQMDANNSIIKELFNIVNDIEKDKVIGNQNIGYVMLLNLFFSFNKESVFDKYMNFSNETLDFSSLLVNNTMFDETDEYVNYFETNEMVPITLEEELTFEKERLNLAKKGIFLNINQNEKKCIWNSKKFALDVENGIHIPNEIILNHIRNALSHGYMDIEGDNFIFYDKTRTSAPRYFEIKISRKKIKELLESDYFNEGIEIPEIFHKNEWNTSIYRTQLSQSHKSFSDFIQIYINKFPHLSVEEVIKYMYNNNKISTYLFEHPSAIREYWRYVIPKTGKLLVDYITNELANTTNDDSVYVGNPSTLYDSKMEAVKSFYNGYLENGDMSYFRALLIHYMNRYSTKSIKEIESECTEKEIKEFANKNFTLSLYMHLINDETEWAAVGNILSNKSEFDRIATAITCHDKYILESFEKHDCDNEQYQFPIVRKDDVYKQGIEYRMSEEMIKYIEEHKLEKIMSKMKIKIGILGLDIIKSVAGREKFNKYFSKFMDYLKKGTILDNINRMHILDIAEKRKMGDEDNDKICNR